MIIAITGYIGAGKTTTAGFFHEHGYKVIEVDELGHGLLDNPEILEKLRAEFGIKILDRDLKIDRAKLSKLVFNNEDNLKTLNRIIHPTLCGHVKDMITRESGDAVIDVALYNELKIGQLVDVTILVTTDIPNIYERLNPQYTKQEILTVMNNQELVAKPDYIIDNNHSMDDLRKRVEKIILKLEHA